MGDGDTPRIWVLKNGEGIQEVTPESADKLEPVLREGASKQTEWIDTAGTWRKREDTRPCRCRACNVADSELTLVDRIECVLGLTEPLSREFIRVALEDIKTFDRKQHDYGSENIAAFGELGVLVRANDKMARLRNLHKFNTRASEESIEDSWRDLSVYGIIARMVRAWIWPNIQPNSP